MRQNDLCAGGLVRATNCRALASHRRMLCGMAVGVARMQSVLSGVRGVLARTPSRRRFHSSDRQAHLRNASGGSLPRRLVLKRHFPAPVTAGAGMVFLLWWSDKMSYRRIWSGCPPCPNVRSVDHASNDAAGIGFIVSGAQRSLDKLVCCGLPIRSTVFVLVILLLS